ncbi:hypothetical protein [Nocardia salmonicida]|uniref:hypothetical protein n=1 Tax=Nocardia salmonicida TaxID=53431 RepID=UPI0007A3B1F8|nr:hypothetical protein [Nocardia salmonicida]
MPLNSVVDALFWSEVVRIERSLEALREQGYPVLDVPIVRCPVVGASGSAMNLVPSATARLPVFSLSIPATNIPILASSGYASTSVTKPTTDTAHLSLQNATRLCHPIEFSVQAGRTVRSVMFAVAETVGDRHQILTDNQWELT